MNTIARVPLTVAARAPRGAVVLARRFGGWVGDRKFEPVMARAIESGRQKEVKAAREDRSQRIRSRVSGLCFAAAVVVPGGWALHVLVWPWVWQAALALLLVAAVAAGGKRTDGQTPTPLIQLPGAAREITPESVTSALSSAVPEISRALRDDPDTIHFPDPVIRDGKGWQVSVDLPAGITSDIVVSRSDRVASAFKRAPLAVSAEQDPAHAGRVNLWVGDKAPVGDVEWALAEADRVDVLRPFEIGIDQRGRPFTITLADRNVLIGAMPGYGKTATLRLILLAAALDPRTEIYAFDLKGGTDLYPLTACSATVVSGDEDDDVAGLLEALRKVRQEIRDRNATIRALPIDERPDGKITTADASRLGWAPVVFAIDEAQIAYENETYGKEIALLTTDIFKRGRSVGVHMMLATQQFDAESVPTKVSNNASLRMCGRVEGFQASNMILGANAHSSGWSAARLTDQGVMWVKGATVLPRVVRVAKVEAPDAWRIARRAAAARGAVAPAPVVDVPEVEAHPEPEPISEPVTIPAHDLAGRVRHVWPAGEDRATSEALIRALQQAYPWDYPGWKPADLGRALGVPAKQVWVDGRNQRGYRLEHLEGALGTR